MKNKILAILLILAMCLSMLPMSVFAADNSTDLIITGGTADTDYTYEEGVLDIKAAGTYEIKNADPATATTDAIRVSAASGEVIVKLGGVNIKPGDKSAFEITGDCETTVILKDGTENSLDNTGARDFAGLQNGEKVLTVTCESSGNTAHECTTACGKLTVKSIWAAAIGGGFAENGSNITVSGGIIIAETELGAGIGGGDFGIGSDITISGGTVTATSEQGAGIGGGRGQIGDDITISGGTVTATSVHGAGIGGGADGGIAENIKIAPAANTEIKVNTGANVSEAEELTYSFAEEVDITALVRENAYFYSKAYCIHADADKDHNCDFGCGKTDVGTHGDTDTDHACDYGCAESIGTHADSATDTDHLCDYGCGATLENCTDAVNDNNHSCDVCGKADVSTHTYGDATCEASATCSECGATTGDALGHKDDNTDHTCDRGCGKTDMGTHAAASGKHTCDYCGNAVTACTDFAEVVKPEALKSAADCTNPAVYYKSCTVCGANGTETFTSGEAHGHTYDEGVITTKPGCETEGVKTFTCTCGHSYTEPVSATGHTYTTTVTAPTCTEKGYTTYTCACGDSYAGDEVAATGHSFTEYKANGDATCTADGTKTVKCDNCEATDTTADTGSKKAHTYEKGKCTVCEATDPNYVPETDSPQTGDNSNMALWFALLLLSGGAVITLTVYDRKRRIKEN